MIKKINSCRICKNKKLVKVLDLGEQYLTGVFPENEKKKISRGPLQLLKCHTGSKKRKVCGLLQIAHDFNLNEMYGKNYGYRSGLNNSMVQHLKDKIKNISKIISLNKNDIVLDIGSNDGTTLKAFTKNKYKLVGIDPAGAKFRKYYRRDIKLIPDFFSSKKFQKHFKDKKAKLITSFSMFYDLDSPLQFMKDVSDILSKDGIWVFEQSYMPLMLKMNSYDTVCHEHKEYYALQQIKWMTDRSGLKIVDVSFNDINGGSFSVTVAHSDNKIKQNPSVEKILNNEKKKNLDNINAYKSFAKRVKNLKKIFKQFLNKAKKEKKLVAALGASTKGNVILQYCGITKKDIKFIGEVNADKFGCITPGSNIPITKEEDIIKEKYDYVIILPWHFKNFFLKNKKINKQNLIFPLPKFQIIKN